MKALSLLLLLSTVGFSATESVTLGESQFKDARTYMKDTYHEILADLKNGKRVKRARIVSAFENDPLLRKETTTDGHNKFVCDLMKISFCVIAHGSKDIESPKERLGFQKNIQIYINVLKLFHQQNENKLSKSLKDMDTKAWYALFEEEQDRYAIYSKQKN